jgi:hypothetical protein
LHEAVLELADHLRHCDTRNPEYEYAGIWTGIWAYAQLFGDPPDQGPAREWLKWQNRVLSDDSVPADDSVREPTPGRPEALLVPEDVTLLVQVATYLGTAALGGIIGNRADAGMVATAQGMFRAVRDRWRRRASADDAALSEDEATDAAKAAAITQAYAPETIRVRASRQNVYGSWIIELAARPVDRRDTELLRVSVPPGDPANATIFIIP